MQYIKDETEFRVGFELQQMEERLLAAQLRNNINARQNGDEFSQSYSVGDNLEEETKAVNEAHEEMMDRNIAADLEAKKCIKEKAMKVAEEENIRKRLRSQGDMNMMDKAKDLASKKNVMSQHVGQLRGRIEGFSAFHLKLQDFFALLLLKPKSDRISLRGGMVNSQSAKDLDMTSFDQLLVGNN
jgi:hypothetical protein